MNQETAERIIQLLESIDSKLDRLGSIDSLLHEVKMEGSGFEHEGKNYPGSSERIIESIDSVESKLGFLEMTLDSIESNTSR
ncbi:MAG: hypothetical protein HY043_19540 [Verrucomicrobia bacterium]|nr:hypothetical protein [Verrucomicrobiota bacterium]